MDKFGYVYFFLLGFDKLGNSQSKLPYILFRRIEIKRIAIIERESVKCKCNRGSEL